MSAPLPSDLRTLLFVLPTWVGDTVMATPVLRAARARFPAARIVAAGAAPLAELLAGCPWIDERIAVRMKGFLGPLRAAAALRRERADAILLLPNSFRSALAARLCGVALRAGYARDGRSALLTHAIAPPPRRPPVPAVEWYARLWEMVSGDAPIDRRVELFVTEEEDRAADALLASAPAPFALLAPGASKAAKRWPAERFAAVGDALAARNLAVVLTGGPDERGVLAAVLGRMRAPALDLTARGVTLATLKAVTRRAAILVTNDTGPRHVAAAVGTPAVVLFGPTDHRWTTLPGARERLLLAEPFLPEELVADDHPRGCAIARISAGDVIAAAEGLLAAPPAAARAAPGAAPR